MAEWTAKRFWKEASVVEAGTGFTVLLDGRNLRTPVKSELIVPTRAMAEAMRNATIYEDVIVTGLGRTENPDMVSEVADLLLRMEGIRCVLCFGFFEDNVLLSIRTHEDDINAGKLAQKMIKRGKYLSENGTAGGHGMMAGGQVGIAGKNEKEIEKISTEIRHCFLEALGVGKRSRRTLIKNN